MRNGVKFGFKRGNIINGREITGNYRENHRRISDFRVSGFDSALENVFTAFCMQNGEKFAFKRRNILNRREITRNFRENQRMKAICESLGLF